MRKRGKFYLVSWEQLARPKVIGGWGKQNIFLFGNALATTNIWRALFKCGMLSDVLKSKYLKQTSVID